MKERGLGNLAAPASVQKLQTALHAKAKTEAGYRFYALYDKNYREDIGAVARRTGDGEKDGMYDKCNRSFRIHPVFALTLNRTGHDICLQ